jgi:hypothetical protein
VAMDLGVEGWCEDCAMGDDRAGMGFMVPGLGEELARSGID